MRRTRLKTDLADVISVAVLIIGIVVIGIILIVLVRLQRGLFGVVLGGAAVALLAYWLREFRKMARKELGARVPPKKHWNYELHEGAEEITVVAEVPGPFENVDTILVERILRVRGGNNFDKEIALPTEVEIVQSSYVNGVLQVKLKKVRK